MQWHLPRVVTCARILSGVLLASSLSVGVAAPASAQSLSAQDIAHPNGQPRGMTLGQALEPVRGGERRAAPAARADAAALVEPAVSAVFVPQSGILAVVGNASDNTLTISRDAAGQL